MGKSDEWDDKEKSKDEIFEIIKKFLPKFLEQQSKPPVQMVQFSVFCTPAQAKQMSEILEKS